MDCICGKVNGSPRFYEVMKTDSELWREIEHAGAAGLAVRYLDVRRILVRGVDQAASALNPWR